MRGLSLMEAVVCASLLGLIFLFMLNVVPSSLAAIRQAEHRLAAGSLAQEVLDVCASRSFQLIQDGAFNPSNPGFMAAYLNDAVLGDQTVLHPSLAVSAVAGVDRATLAELAVTITWQERQKSLSLTRLLRLSSIQR